jgi:hypothetical protein
MALIRYKALGAIKPGIFLNIAELQSAVQEGLVGLHEES